LNKGEFCVPLLRQLFLATALTSFIVTVVCSPVFAARPLRILGLADDPLTAVEGGPAWYFAPCLLFSTFDVILKRKLKRGSFMITAPLRNIDLQPYSDDRDQKSVRMFTVRCCRVLPDKFLLK
jgi:hypothetical protein